MIVIDGNTYNVPIVSIERKFDMLYKSAERTQDGILHSELIGVYKNYEVTFGMSANNVEEYAALILKVSEPVESHSVTILEDTYNAYFSNIRDEVVRDTGTPYFRNLSMSIIALGPHRT